ATAPDDRLGAFWYGDAFAVRGYTVLAVEIGHRGDVYSPVFDDGHGTPVLTNYEEGPGQPNSFHDSIIERGTIARPAPKAADWERAWDVMQAITWLRSLPDFDQGSHITVVGLSLGGEVATWIAALDERVDVAIPCGHSPDLDFESLPEVAHICLHWRWADETE